MIPDDFLNLNRMKRFMDSTREGKMYGKRDDDGNLPHEPLFPVTE